MPHKSNRSKELEDKKNERIFRELPKLGSPEYMVRLEAAAAAELPAPVLARAFRELMTLAGPEERRLSRPAEATLARLLTTEHEYAYFRALRNEARQIRSEDDWFDVEELVFEGKQEVGIVLASDRGARAHENWASFQIQRVQDAWRRLNGRRGERKERERATPVNDETGGQIDPTEVTREGIEWHGHFGIDVEGWLRDFAFRTVATIEDPNIRGVAEDQWGDNPSKISSADPSDTSTLAHRYGVERYTIYRWLRAARAVLRAALDAQDEMEIDVSWLKIR